MAHQRLAQSVWGAAGSTIAALLLITLMSACTALVEEHQLPELSVMHAKGRA